MPLQTLIRCLALTLTIQQYFEVKIPVSLVTSVTVIITTIIAEMILMINPFFVSNIVIIRDNMILFTFTNLCGMMIGYLLAKIKFLNNIINKFISKFEKNSKRNELIALIFLLSSTAFFGYLVVINRNIKVNAIALLVFIVILCILSYIYIYEKNSYSKLTYKYNNLLEYAYTYEEKLDKDKLMRHEYKNQLAVIKGMTKSKKIINYIDELLKNNKEEENINTKGINNIPKGGMRGLIYYKLCLINKKKINYSIDVSKNVKRELTNLSENDKRILSYLIGVFLDNAIEECEKKSMSNISIEIYKLSKDINIIISNTIHSNINLRRIGEKGYTTKGRNHGNGIYLVKKLLKENEKIKVNTKIINNYFVQEIKINTTKKDA